MHSKSDINKFIICTCYVRDKNDISEFFTSPNEAIKNINKNLIDVTIIINGDFESRLENLNSLDENLTLPNGNSQRVSRDQT